MATRRLRHAMIARKLKTVESPGHMATTAPEQELIVKTVREFVDREVMPVASAMEHREHYRPRSCSR